MCRVHDSLPADTLTHSLTHLLYCLGRLFVLFREHLSVGQLLTQAAVMAKRAGSYQNGLVYARVSQYLIGVDPINPLTNTASESDQADSEEKLDTELVGHR